MSGRHGGRERESERELVGLGCSNLEVPHGQED